jgi:hypothetical protein
MSLDVIGAGLGRTGTLSLKAALEQLGFAPCHHMTEIFAHPEQIAFWQRAAEGEPVDWEEIYKDYRASVDWPGCHFYRQLAEAYPRAKVILSVRDPKRWYDSMRETILKRLRMAREAAEPGRRPQFAEIIIAQETFQGREDEEGVIAAYERHIANVKRDIPAERLLVYNVAEGWEPLCRFLEVPVPQAAFPRTNSRDDFWERFALREAEMRRSQKR